MTYEYTVKIDTGVDIYAARHWLDLVVRRVGQVQESRIEVTEEDE